MDNGKVRIYELSQELNLGINELLAICHQMNIPVKSIISQSEAESIRLQVEKLGVQSSVLPVGNFENTKPESENWGYKFVGSAIDSLIRNLESQAVLEAYSEFQERRELADELMRELFGQLPCLFYLRRKGSGKVDGEEIWELTIATDTDDALLPSRLEKLGQTLGLRVAVEQNGYGGLKILSTRLLPLESGYTDGYALPCLLRLLPNYKYRINIPSEALARIAKMPICGDYLPTEEQIKAWKVFLQIEKRIAQTRQFCISFIGHNYGSATKTISFDIDVSSATVDGSEDNTLDVEDFWQRVKRARNEDIRLYETVPNGKNWNKSFPLGSIEGFDSKHCVIRVRLERELTEQIVSGSFELPSQGFLSFQAAGDIQQIRRKQKALDDLYQGRTQNPYLGNFFFDASQARPVQNIVQLRPEDLLLSSANPSQKAAVEMALATQDLALIQGPPGTGKTTVIAEICYQVALRGGRTLIASQTNLAVDNALSRLVHNPVIRAVRKGNAESVTEDGLPFLEKNVIDRWLKNTATYCETNISQKLADINSLRQLLELSKQLSEYAKLEEIFQQEHKLLETRKSNLELACTNKNNEYQQITAQLTEAESLKVAVDNLLNQVPSVDWEDAELVNLWASLTPYISTDIYVRDFSANLRIAINLASELGIVHPNVSLFGLAAWLHNTVTVNISELKTALDYANHTATAIIEADSAANLYRQNSQSFAEINSNHKQLILVQQNLQTKISKIQKRQAEIHSLNIVLDTWLLTAESSIFNRLKQSLKNRQKFTVELIAIPVEIVAVMQEYHNKDWQNILADSQLKFDDLVQKYSQWVKASSLLGEIRNLLVRGQNLLGNRRFTESDVSQISFSKEIDSVIFLLKLKQIAQKSIDSIEKPLNIWEKIVDWMLTFALNYKSFNSSVKLLRKYSRSYSALITLEAIKRQAKVTLQKVKPIDSESILTQMTIEAVQRISTTARTWLNQLQVQTEEVKQQLEEQLAEKVDLAKKYQQQILSVQDELKNFQNEADFKLKRAIALLQELAQFSHLPNELKLVVPAQVENTSSLLPDITQFTAKISLIENKIKQLENAASLIDNIGLLLKIQCLLTDKISHTKSTALKCDGDLREYQQRLNEVLVQLEQKLEKISTEKRRLKSSWEKITDKFKSAITVTNLFDKQTTEYITNQTNNWQQQLKNEEFYLKRYHHFIQDWIEKLRQPSESDRNELKRIYLNNANVVGITCVQAANRNFSDEFKYFDVVIIDEVSKCTPPELLIPALKGKKLVMVGDHKQLPPMLDTHSLEEVAQEIGCTREELEFLEESIFKLQFESADDSIK